MSILRFDEFMKTILQDGRRRVLRFDKDEELMSGLAQYAKDNKIPGAYFSAIGSCTSMELGYFNIFLKEYRKKQFLDNLEILSLTGTLAQLNGEPSVHAHGSFASNDFGMLGGHVFKMVVLATCEVVLIVFDQPLNREANADFNLNLLA